MYTNGQVIVSKKCLQNKTIENDSNNTYINIKVFQFLEEISKTTEKCVTLSISHLPISCKK